MQLYYSFILKMTKAKLNIDDYYITDFLDLLLMGNIVLFFSNRQLQKRYENKLRLS